MKTTQQTNWEIFFQFMFNFKKLINRIIVWFLFTVAIGILPLFWKAIQVNIINLKKDDVETMDLLYGQGDLSLIGYTIVASSISKLFRPNKMKYKFITTYKYICGGLSIITLGTTIFFYAQLSLFSSPNVEQFKFDSIDDGFTESLSLILFFTNLVVSLSCLISSEL